jgi:ABC-2 type transport system ATP-binding protein
MKSIIRADRLVRRFGATTALAGLTFEVDAGEVIGCVGPNGAGKTTLIRLLNGVLAPSEGTVSVLGLNPVADGNRLRRRTGIMTDGLTLYDRLTARQNLRFYGTLCGVEDSVLDRRIDELLDFFELTGRDSDKVGTYSTGMKQRLSIARAVIHNPDLLFLDEPTASLDPEAGRQVTDLIGRLSAKEGRTILLATHNLAEAQRLCRRVMVLKQGNLLAFEPIERLIGQMEADQTVEITLEAPAPPCLSRIAQDWPSEWVTTDDGVDLRVRIRSRADIPGIVRRIVQEGGGVVRVVPKARTLEDVYFALQRSGGQTGDRPDAVPASRGESR